MMTSTQKYWMSQTLAGLGFCLLFGILAAVIGGEGYIAAAVVCGIIGIVSGIIFFARY